MRTCYYAGMSREIVDKDGRTNNPAAVNQARFLAAFGVCGQIGKAARWCKLHRHAHYNWMQEDPTYPARFAEAEKKAIRTLRDEAVRRAHDGLRKPVWYKGKIVGYETEYSDTLLLGLLKGLDPEFRDQSDIPAQAGSSFDNKVAILLRIAAKLPEESRAIVAQELRLLESAK